MLGNAVAALQPYGRPARRVGVGSSTASATASTSTLLGPLGRSWCRPGGASRLVRRSEDGWIHRYREGIAVHPRLGGPLPCRQDQTARDHFLYRYSPRRGDAALDVGAGSNPGAVVLHGLVGATGRVISVEGPSAPVPAADPDGGPQPASPTSPHSWPR